MPEQKFSIYDTSNGDITPLFTTKLQETACVGCLRGTFLGEEIGDDVMVTWMKQNRRLETPAFRTELYELLDELRSNGTLNSFPAMEEYCKAHPEARMSDGQAFYAFCMDSSQYRYHLRLFPQVQKFYIFCYRTDRIREDRPTPDFNALYRSKKKRRDRGNERT
jgi:hypothetical protein